MKKILTMFRNTPARQQESVYQEWDRLRTAATSPSELAEIDAIFSRQA